MAWNEPGGGRRNPWGDGGGGGGGGGQPPDLEEMLRQMKQRVAALFGGKGSGEGAGGSGSGASASGLGWLILACCPSRLSGCRLGWTNRKPRLLLSGSNVPLLIRERLCRPPR